MFVVCGVLAVAGIAAFIEDGANHVALGATDYALLRILAWALVVAAGLLGLTLILDRLAAALGHPRPHHPHPAYVGWPPTRLDLFAAIGIAVAAYACVEHEWTIVGAALFGILVAALLPRMEGAFKIGGPVPLEGILTDGSGVQLDGIVPNDASGQPLETGLQAGPQQQDLLGTTQSPGD
ncbi:MAG: hypothetical protein WAU69_03155 [Solirubrobacteraceae bacterium]